MSPTGDFINNPEFAPDLPESPDNIRRFGPEMTVTTYPIRSGGAVIVDVTSTGGLAIEGLGGANAEVSRAEIRGEGLRVLNRAVLPPGGTPLRIPGLPSTRATGDDEVVVDVVRQLLADAEAGTMAVVAPAAEVPALARALDAALPGEVGDGHRRALSARVSVLAPEEVKGLEFDDVVVVEPAAIIAGSSRGRSDLYVAMSRPTRRLVVVLYEALPDGMDGVDPW